MSHPIYSRQQLINRGLAKVKKVAGDLGVLPNGDKRLITSWADAIIEHQSKIVAAEPETATIECDNDSYEGLTQPYMVVVLNKIVHRSATYAQALRFVQSAKLILIEPQEVAQTELEAELEAEAELEIAELEIKEIDFGYHEVVKVNGEVVATISVNFENDSLLWAVNKGLHRSLFAAYEDAAKFAVANYNDERGSGRLHGPIEDIGYLIEDTLYADSKGQQYSVKHNGLLAGYIWLDDRWGWTMNGEDFHHDWRPAAKHLVRLTKRFAYV